MKNDWYSESQPEPDNWQAAQQADEDQHRRQIAECWQRIKRGEYTESDLQVVETELRAIL